MTLSDVSKLKGIVAADIWYEVHSEDVEYIKGFFEGCKDCEKGITESNKNALYNFWRFKAIERTKQNLVVAREMMDKVKIDSLYKPIIEDRLYYKVLREGSGEGIKNNLEANVHLTIKNQRDEVLKDSYCVGPETFELNDVIPGLRLGMVNMKEKEIREIVIHPSLAYGLYTTNESGIALRIQIEMRGIGKVISELQPVVFASMEMPNCEFEGNNIVYDAGHKHGFDMWQHYNKQPFFGMDQMKVTL